VIYNGGTLHIDDGRPGGRAFDETIGNLREIAPTMYMSVPRAFEDLVQALDRDQDLATTFFSRLNLLFYAGASLSQSLSDAIQRIALRVTGERLIVATSLGSTETAPMALCRTWESEIAAAVGLPVPGLDAKIVPTGGTFELRVRGPNVTPGYWREPVLSADAFDDEGFFRMGDAVRLVDPEDPGRGLLFDGRLGEDFKLSNGTWVRVGPLRSRLQAALAPLASDIVIAGHDRRELAALLVPNAARCRAAAGVDSSAPLAAALASGAVRDTVRAALAAFNADATGASVRVARAVFVDSPLSLDDQEVTDKGSINQRAVLSRRAALVDALFQDPPPANIIESRS
jgi:feruloyl-CoA synthase